MPASEHLYAGHRSYARLSEFIRTERTLRRPGLVANATSYQSLRTLVCLFGHLQHPQAVHAKEHHAQKNQVIVSPLAARCPPMPLFATSGLQTGLGEPSGAGVQPARLVFDHPKAHAFLFAERRFCALADYRFVICRWVWRRGWLSKLQFSM